MKRRNKITLYAGAALILAFMVWTVLLRFVDVGVIGPKESSVGFAAMNGYVHSITGVNMSLYTITDWLGLVPIGVAFGFALLGLIQWIKRRNILKVDRSLLTLGGFYIVVILVYVLFEKIVINYRPVLINNHLEASYPSSTTMLVMCVMPTAIMQLNVYIKRVLLRRCAAFTISAFVAFMVIGRLMSGVHWISDIIGGALISGGLVMLFYSITAKDKHSQGLKGLQYT